jgi:Protein of unknown function (DUF4236)/Bacterial SH3 domain
MGYFKFRRRIKIAPGVHWNIGKKGSSLSFGGRGLTHTIGPQGSRTTIGIPGTGVSYTHVQPHSRPATMPTSPPSPSASPSTPPSSTSVSRPNPLQRKPSRIFYMLGFIMLGIWLISKFSEQNASMAKPGPQATPLASTSPEHDYNSSGETQSNATASSPYGTHPANPNLPTVPRAIPVKPTESPTVLRAIPLEPTAPPGSPSTTPVVASYRVVNDAPSGFLNLRETPSSTSRVVVEIRAGTGGIRIGESRVPNGPTFWQKISVGPYTGWVNEIYLEAEKATP